MALGVLNVAAILAACSSMPRVADTFENLTRWQGIGDPVWRVDRTAVIAGPSTGSGYLVSTEEYGDFRLVVDFWIEDETNSGIFVRCNDATSVTKINPTTCYEINIWDNHPNQEFRTGSLVTLAPPKQQVDTLGRWNTYEIVVNGAMINVALNGVETISIQNDKLASGTIALQYMGGGRLEFRKLRIERF